MSANLVVYSSERRATNSKLQLIIISRSRAGWKPVVLTADAAKQHADFETINAMLDGPFGEYDVRVNLTELCSRLSN